MQFDTRHALLIAFLNAGACAQEPAPVDARKFTEMSAAAGVNWWSDTVNILSINNLYDHGFGFAAGDFDGDSYEDLLLLTHCGPTGYFLGNGDGTFRDASTRMTPLNSGIRVAVTYGDYDNDGDVDFYVSYFRHPNVLLQKQPDGSFVDVAPALGVALNGHYTGATFGDFNRDGWLDLVVAGGKLFTTDTLGPPIEGCPAYFEGLHASSMFNNMGTEASVFLQNGGPSAGFVFADVWVAAGIPRAKMCEKDMGFGDVVAADLDLDGALDLVFAEMFQNTKALRNDGHGHFTDMTAQWFPQVSRGPASASVSDFNNDGRPDVFFSDMHSDMWMLPPGILYSSIEPSTRYKGTAGASDGVGDNPTGPLFGNALFFGLGADRFASAPPTLGTETFQPWGNLPADFDNDGFDDIFLPAGVSAPIDYIPNAFLQNTGGGFVRREKDLDFDPPPQGAFNTEVRFNGQPLIASSRTSAVSDLNENGDLDLIVMNWAYRISIMRNDLPKRSHWLDVRVEGTLPRDPYGTRVRVKARRVGVETPIPPGTGLSLSVDPLVAFRARERSGGRVSHGDLARPDGDHRGRPTDRFPRRDRPAVKTLSRPNPPRP